MTRISTFPPMSARHEARSLPRLLRFALLPFAMFMILEVVGEVFWPRPISRMGWEGSSFRYKVEAREIIDQLHVYAKSHDGHYPKVMDELAEAGNVIHPTIYLGQDSPRGYWIYLRGKSPYSADDDLVIVTPVIATKSSFLLRAFLSWRGYLNPLPPKPTRVLGFNDGSSKEMTEEEFQKLLKDHQITLPPPVPVTVK